MNDKDFLRKAFYRIRTRKWRQTNPKLYKIMNAKHQLTWRIKNPDLNRQRAKVGMRALNMYKDIVKLSRRR